MTGIRVSELNIYPVKSLRQISLQKSKLGMFGLENDRRWMVVDDQGMMLTQRQISRMCLIQPSLQENGIKLSVEGKPDITINIPDSGEVKSVTVWDDECRAYDAGVEAANWLSEFLLRDCRLVYFPDDEFRQVDLQYANQGERTAFSDGFPLLLISQASLDDLNRRLSQPITMNRFRPNLVVSGCDAYAEDQWRKIRIGNINFRIVKPCSRCVIPNIDIETGRRGNEPAATLVSYRRKDNNIFFGQNVITEGVGELTIDMPVEIIK